MRLRLRAPRPEMLAQGPSHRDAGSAPDVDWAKRSSDADDAVWPSELYRDAFKDPHRAAQILQLLLSSQTWVHRRVEAVVFRDGTTATRKVSVDFTLPAQAPTCAVCAVWAQADGHHPEGNSIAPSALELPPRLVPITLLPKRSLVNFDLRDESGAALPHLALRQNQDLTFALLCIWARHVLTPPGTAAKDAGVPELAELECEVTKTLWSFTYGKRDEFLAALDCLRKPEDGNEFLAALECDHEPDGRGMHQLQQLAEDDRFKFVLELLAYDFMLIVEVPDKLPYRHVYKVSYDTAFRPEHRTTLSSDEMGEWKTRWRNRGQKWLTAFGWRDTSFEFDTPEAKLAQSYHLKVQVPASVEVSKAILLAGQDHQPEANGRADERSQRDMTDSSEEESFHLDTAGGSPMVDLHVVEVGPHQSARARVVLKARRSGWLGSACLAGLVAFATVFLVSRHIGAFYPLGPRPAEELELEQITILVGTLAGVSALLATLLSSASEHPMVSELLYLLRPLSSLAMLMPFLAGAVLIIAPNPIQGFAVWVFQLVTMLSGLLAVVLVVAWLKGRRKGLSTDSPWRQDMTEDEREQLAQSQGNIRSRLARLRLVAPEADDPPANYREAWDRYRFGRPAVKTEARRHQTPPGDSLHNETAKLVKMTGSKPESSSSSSPARP